MGEVEREQPIEVCSTNEDVFVLTDPSSLGTINKHEGFSRETNAEASFSKMEDEASSSTIHEEAFSCQQNDEVSISKVYVGLNNNKPDDDFPSNADEVVCKPGEEVSTGNIHDDASNQVHEDSSPKPVEEISTSSLVNDSLSGNQVEPIEGHNNKEDISDEKLPSKADEEESANKTDTESSRDRRDVVSPSEADDKAGNNTGMDLHSKADEEPIKLTDDKPVEATDKALVNSMGEKSASPVPLPDPRFRGKTRFKPVPGLSSSSNRPTL